MTRTRWAVLAVVVALVGAFVALDLGRYFTLEYLQQSRGAVEGLRHSHPFAVAAAYFALYVLVTGLSLPGAVVLTLAGGAVFGLVWGTVIVSFASTIGATLAMVASRFLLRDLVQKRYGDRLAAINEGIRKDGGFYLFSLRLVPAFPFFLINLAMGLTPIPVRTFYWVSQAGMLAGTIVFVNAGTELGKLTSLEGILSPTLIGSFVLLGLFPLIARKALEKINARRTRVHQA